MPSFRPSVECGALLPLEGSYRCPLFVPCPVHGTDPSPHGYALRTERFVDGWHLWKWACGCGATGRWTGQSGNVAYFGWLRHVERASARTAPDGRSSGKAAAGRPGPEGDDMTQDPHASMAEVGGQVVLEVKDPATDETVVFTGPDDADVERQAEEHFGPFAGGA